MYAASSTLFYNLLTLDTLSDIVMKHLPYLSQATGQMLKPELDHHHQAPGPGHESDTQTLSPAEEESSLAKLSLAPRASTYPIV